MDFCPPSKAGTMAAMQNRASASRWAISSLVALAAIALASPALAKGKKKPDKPYVFELTRIELKKGVPQHVHKAIEKQIAAAIDAHEQLIATLDDDAPDPDKEPKKYEAYLKRRNQRAFKVNVEVTSYTHEVEQDERVRRLTVSIALRMFGETIPQRVMAFSGDGSATVKIDIGKKLRKRDTEYANEEAMKLAVEEALATSIKKLKAPPDKSKKKRRKRKKK